MRCAANFNKRSEQVAGGVFLIGLALLFMTGDFFPGILIVIGLSVLAKGIAEGKQLNEISGWAWLIGLGVVFTLGFSFPLLLIGLGVWMLFGRKHLNGGHWGSWHDGDKRKPRRKNDGTTTDETYVVGERFQA